MTDFNSLVRDYFKAGAGFSELDCKDFISLFSIRPGFDDSKHFWVNGI